MRDHFNCSTLEGAELEDQGVIGTALTHWEKRVFEVCDVMTKVKGIVSGCQLFNVSTYMTVRTCQYLCVIIYLLGIIFVSLPTCQYPRCKIIRKI